MKTPQTLILLAVAVPGLLFAQTKDAAKPDADTEKALMKLEQDMSVALTKADVATAEKNLADGFYAVIPDGTTQSKAEFVADLKSGNLKLESNNLTDMKVHAAGADMAVVTYRSDDKGTYKGKDISGQYRWVDVLVKRGGAWQFIVSQGTSLADAKNK